nr:EOG090X07W1 [Triops cancriformis]
MACNTHQYENHTAPEDEKLARFCSSVGVWSQKPQVLNKRLSGVFVLWSYEAVDSDCLLDGDQEWIRLPQNFLGNVTELENEVKALAGKKQVRLKPAKDSHWREAQHLGTFISLRKLLCKKTDDADSNSWACELEIVDLSKCKALYVPLLAGTWAKSLSATDPYSLSVIGSKVHLHSANASVWMQEKVLPKIQQWYDEDLRPDKGPRLPTLGLVNLDQYNSKYQFLKTKYGPQLCQNWLESTDPQKFVYEDIAIASYLLLLWEMERQETGSSEKQTFLDLGCGNGLLVFLLAAEGHVGRGWDLRARKIWSTYPDFVQLEGIKKEIDNNPVMVTDSLRNGTQAGFYSGPQSQAKKNKEQARCWTPSPDCQLPRVDWLLGNHTDELTPWVPVLAARESIPGQHVTRFFLLPCCPFTFDGKYLRGSLKAQTGRVSGEKRNHDVAPTCNSRYAEYLEFVGSLGEALGYNMEKDRLRIPSTRRICWLGRVWNPVPNLEHVIEDLLQKHSHSTDKAGEVDFKPRPAIEPVRNCTKVAADVTQRVVDLTTKLLLEGVAKEGEWTAGKQLPLGEVAGQVPAEDLQALKNECGGLQTLLRNHSHIFCVSGGVVRLRPPNEEPLIKRRKVNKSKQQNVKRKPCWFAANHPQGCPLDAEACRFHHE